MAAHKATTVLVEGLEGRQLYSASAYSAKWEALPHIYTQEYIHLPVATLKHPINPNLAVTAKIDWGDGHVEDDSGLVSSNSDSELYVTSGSFLNGYIKPGSYVAKVTFSQGNKILATARKTIVVTRNSVGGSTVQTKTGDTKPIVLGTITSTQAPGPLFVSWGDSDISAAVATPLKHNQYRITASHSYTTAGTYLVRLMKDDTNVDTQYRIAEQGDLLGSTLIVRGSSAANPAPLATLVGVSSPLSPRQLVIATVQGIAPGTFSLTPYAYVSWDGGSQSLAKVSIVDGHYAISATPPIDTVDTTATTHVATVQLVANENMDATKDRVIATLTETVSVEPTTPGAVPVQGTVGQTFTGSLGTFTALPGKTPTSLFLKWGDLNYALGSTFITAPGIGVGASGDPATLTPLGNGQYDVSTTHTFGLAGRILVIGQINYDDGTFDTFVDYADVSQ